MVYGIPYKGSKNAIAMWIVDNLPPAEHFYDLFCGGCAVTHAAMISQKWKKFTINDINFMPKLFIDAILGKYKDEKRWISREDFLKLKDSDPYVATCWSFGNNLRDYLYGVEIEAWKKALHYARAMQDLSLLREFGIAGNGSRQDIVTHYSEYRDKYINWLLVLRCNMNTHERLVGSSGLQYLEHLERLQRLLSLKSLKSLQGLESLQSLKRLQGLERMPGLKISQHLQIPACSQCDYEQVDIAPNSTVYCDIPYVGTDDYSKVNKFDHARFYEWALSRDFPVYISEYQMPAGFATVAERCKNVLFARGGCTKKAIERLFVQQKFYNNYKITLF